MTESGTNIQFYADSYTSLCYLCVVWYLPFVGGICRHFNCYTFVYSIHCTVLETRALLRLEMTMNLIQGRGGEGREGREGRGGREGGRGGGREGWMDGWMTVIHILIRYVQ